MNLNKPEIIEAYLKGQLSQAEKISFETQLEQDPLFKSEMELQKDIVNSIKDYRRAQLKQRLDSIEVSSSVGQFTAVKIATSIVVVSMLGIGAYVFFTDKAAEKIAYKSEATEIVVEPSIANPSQIEEETSIKNNETLPIQSFRNSTSKEERVKKEHEGNALVVSPNVTDDFEENQVVMKDSGIGHSIKPVTPPAERLEDIEILNEDIRSKDFKYKYLNKKLYLYGDFTSAPYELLEFNLNTRTLFLFHNSIYYQLNENQVTITPLVAIKDSTVIKELEASRDKK